MRKKLEKRAHISPAPVLMVASYNEDGSVNIMNAAWGTMQSFDKIMVNLGKANATTKNIKKRGSFTVSFADIDHVEAADFVGLVSGNNYPNKFEDSGFEVEKSEFVDAPIIKDLPVCLECEFIEYQDEENGAGVIGEVVNASVDEKALTDGVFDPVRAGLLVFDPISLSYYSLGEYVADAYSVGNKLKKN